QHERKRWLCGACSGVVGLDRDTALAEVALASLSATRPARFAGEGYLRHRLARGIQYPRVPDRAVAYGRAGARHTRVRTDQQHHGSGQDRCDPAVRILWSQLHSSGKLPSLLPERMERRAGWWINHLLHLYW